MKIALINIYSRQNEYQSRYSLATMRLAENVMSFGYDVDLIPVDINNYQSINFDEIKNYDLIGLSNYSWVENAIKFIDKLIKEKNPDVNIVIGGPQVDNVNLEEWDNEYFIIGEGKKDEKFFDNNVNIFN